jgi:hypothetical protein
VLLAGVLESLSAAVVALKTLAVSLAAPGGVVSWTSSTGVCIALGATDGFLGIAATTVGNSGTGSGASTTARVAKCSAGSGWRPAGFSPNGIDCSKPRCASNTSSPKPSQRFTTDFG